MMRNLLALLLLLLGMGLAAESSAQVTAHANWSGYQDYLYVWGNNDSDRAGDGVQASTFYLTANYINSLPRNVTQITAGDNSSCAIANELAYCWGNNTLGKLGNGNTTAQSTPALVSGSLTGWTDIDNGAASTCGIAQGVAYCWGDNASGALGRGNSTGSSNVPTLVLGGWSDWTDIDVGSDTACGIRGGGIMYCWGESSSGLLGNGNASTDRTSPSLVSGGITNWASVSVTSRSACALTTDGTLYCWGENGNGQVGDNTTTDRTVPTLQYNTSGWTWKVAKAGLDYGCGIRSDAGNEGRLFCWGNNSWGRKQTGNNNRYPEEAKINNGSGAALSDWVKIAPLTDHTCGIRAGGRIYCWGNGNRGKIGEGTNNTFTQINMTANPVEPLSGGDYGYIDVAVGTDHTMTIRRDRNITATNGASGVGSNRSTLGPPAWP